MNHGRGKKEMLLMQQIYATLMALAKKLDRQDNGYFRGLTARQYMVLRAVRHAQQDKTTMVDIANRLGTAKQNFTQLISILEKKGYVTRAARENNRRTVSVDVTELGLSAMLEYAGTGTSVMTDIFNDFTQKEMKTLWHLLKKLYRYDGVDYPSSEADTIQLFESEYSGAC